tara:strand:- start:88 stop:342 length:255 start_codon:yes stop_codon:yes gene_type:complete
MKYAILRVAKIIEWATGDDYDKCVKWREDNQFGCIIGYDDLLNIENEIRTAYEMGVFDGERSVEDDDIHALSNKLITEALKRGD